MLSSTDHRKNKLEEVVNLEMEENVNSGIWNNPYSEGITYESSNSYGIDNRRTSLTGMSGWERNASTTYYATAKDGTKQINNDGSITITFIPKIVMEQNLQTYIIVIIHRME